MTKKNGLMYEIMNNKIRLFDNVKDVNLVESFLTKKQESYRHHTKQSVNWFNWKFFSRFKKESILSCVFSNGEIFGCNSFGNFPLMYNNIKIKALLSYENFVHPKFQKQGVFNKLIEYSEQASIKKGFDLLMVFPNEKSLKGYTNRNWTKKKGYIHYWLKPIYNLKLVFNFLDVKKKFVANSPPQKYNFNFRNFNSNIYKNVYTSSWSKECLNWRFNEMPQAEYCYVKTNEFESVARIGKRGRLTELQILYLNPKSLQYNKSEFKKIVSLFQKKVNPDLISFPISIDNPFYNKMNSIGFYKLKSKTNFVYKINPNTLNKLFKISLSGIDFHTY